MVPSKGFEPPTLALRILTDGICTHYQTIAWFCKNKGLLQVILTADLQTIPNYCRLIADIVMTQVAVEHVLLTQDI